MKISALSVAINQVVAYCQAEILLHIYCEVVHERVKISMGEKWLSLQSVKVVKILV